MRIIAVDNNQSDLDVLRAVAATVFPDSKVSCFTDPMMAIKYCMEHPPDLVLCERDLKRMDGFALVKMLRQKFPGLRGVLISGGTEWRRDAENLMLGYMVKPATADKLQRALGEEKTP